MLLVYLNEDITKCLDTYCNNNLYVSTTVFIIHTNKCKRTGIPMCAQHPAT